jgi:hypothetical protein
MNMKQNLLNKPSASLSDANETDFLKTLFLLFSELGAIDFFG